MDAAKQSASVEKKIEFLKFVIEAHDRRRNSFESRFSVFVAFDAALLIGLMTISTAQRSPNYSLELGSILVSLVFTVLSFCGCMAFLFPLRFQWLRRLAGLEVPKDSKSEHNLYLFLRIAQLTKDGYHDAVNALTEEGIFEQLSAEVHNLSKQLVFRYNIMLFTLITFAMGAVAFAFYAAVKFIG